MMAFFRKLTIFLTIALVFWAFTGISVQAEEKLDEIEDYTITINVREDGTLDIRYDVVWKVLSDKNSSEPVTWVKIGIPNSHVDSIEAITSNIKSAKYYSSGGDFVRVDFDEKYYEDKIINFSFTIHQSYMYMLEDNSIKYSFTAGWFENIVVKQLTIKWNKMWVDESTALEVSEDGKYLIWKTENIPEGEHYSISVRYPKGTFAIDENQKFDQGLSSDTQDIVFVIIIIVVALILLFIVIVLDDHYNGGSGFGRGGHSTFISNCTSSSCASSCACACACAGGGRAGCSVKDFYTGNIKPSQDIPNNVTIFDKVLSEETK